MTTRRAEIGSDLATSIEFHDDCTVRPLVHVAVVSLEKVDHDIADVIALGAGFSVQVAESRRTVQRR
jgi:hypothetical protein